MKQLVEVKMAMVDFPRHRFNHYHTKEVFHSTKEGLIEGQILKIQDFSENYTLVPDEIQSLHWTQTQTQTIRLFAQRNMKTDHVYFEISHSKGPSDGVGGVTKKICSIAVSAQI